MSTRSIFPDLNEVQHVAVIGTGLIGAGWVAQFLLYGLKTTVWDPAPDFEDRRSFSNTHVLVTSRSASAPVLTSAISLASTSDPVGGVAVTITVLRTNLVSATSDVITYVAV